MGFAAVDQPKILLLSGAETKTAALSAVLSEQGAVRVVDSCQEAVEAIQDGHVDLVVSEAGDFLPADCAQCTRWIKQALVSIDEGVACVDLDGQVVWANVETRAMPQPLLDAVAQSCLDVADEWRDHDEADGPYRQVIRRASVTIPDRGEIDFEVAVSPVVDPAGRLHQMAAVVRDVTAAMRVQQRLKPVDEAGQQLVGLNPGQYLELDTPQRAAKIEEQIVSHARSLMNFERFSIRLLDPKTGLLNVAMAQGMSECIWDREITVASEGQGICGYAAAMGRSYLCADTTKDPRYLQGIGNAGSSLTVPLWLHDQIVGVFNVESDCLGAFDDVDRQMLETFGQHVAMALKILDLLVIERYRSTGKLADDVSSEIAAPLNDIMSEASALMSEYIGDESLRERLESITRNAGRIRESVKQAGRPANGLRHPTDRHTPPDPLLAGRRLLVADDEDAIRETLYEVLTHQGCEVATARDGAEAAGMLSQSQYDLVLSDIRMPHKNGYEVFATAKARNPDCAVILMTGFGYDPSHSVVRAHREGLSAVLFKPFKVDQLLIEVRQALEAAPSW